MIEVKATTSFGTFRIGERYEVDESERMTASLIDVGYLVPTKAVGSAETEPAEPVSALKVAPKPRRRKASETTEVNDGQGALEPGGGDSDSPEAREASGEQGGGADPDRVEATGQGR